MATALILNENATSKETEENDFDEQREWTGLDIALALGHI